VETRFGLLLHHSASGHADAWNFSSLGFVVIFQFFLLRSSVVFVDQSLKSFKNRFHALQQECSIFDLAKMNVRLCLRGSLKQSIGAASEHAEQQQQDSSEVFLSFAQRMHHA
jgi:hypothetical protein